MAARSSDDWTGLRLLEHYTLTSFLGSGPIGSVYIGNDERTGRKVAVKVPHLRFLETAASRDEFQLSMRRFLPVAHPNLVRVLDTGAHMGVPFVVERFQLGGSLADRILERGGRLVPLEVMEWLPPIAKALDYLHRQGRLHRDMKPSNILYDTLGNVTLSDAGLVEALGSPDPRLLALAASPGTAMPIPPDPRPGPYSDQYALAAMVYRVLGGDMPIPTASASTLAESPLPRVPPRAAQAVMRALSPEARDRFASCSDFARAFERGLQRAHEPASPPSQEMKDLVSVAAPPPPSSGLVDAALVALVLAAGGGSVWIIGGTTQRPAPPHAVVTRAPTEVPAVAPTAAPDSPIGTLQSPIVLPAAATVVPARSAFNGAAVTGVARTVELPTETPGPDSTPSGSRARARARARSGDLAGAANVFRASLAEALNQFTVQITMNARDETASKGFASTPADFELILLDNPKNGRWYLCVGLYTKESDAKRAVAKVPEFFRGQQPTVRPLREILEESR